MLRLALSLHNKGAVSRDGWELLASGILARSSEGVDEKGQKREKFSQASGLWAGGTAPMIKSSGKRNRARSLLAPRAGIPKGRDSRSTLQSYR